jgi:hypothetical protein
MADKVYSIADFQEELATAPSGLALGVPLHVFLGEAVDVAAFFEEYFATVERDGVVTRAGLDRAGPRLKSEDGAKILALVKLTQEAQTKLALSARAAGEDSVGRAREVIAELDAMVAWVLDDGVDDDRDAKLAAVRQTHAEGASLDALAAELADYAGLGRELANELGVLPDFRPELLDEADQLVEALRKRPGAGAKVTPEAEALRRERNALVGALARRVQLVRGAARFVFRGQPALIRRVTSAYERRRRRETRTASGGTA